MPSNKTVNFTIHSSSAKAKIHGAIPLFLHTSTCVVDKPGAPFPSRTQVCVFQTRSSKKYLVCKKRNHSQKSVKWIVLVYGHSPTRIPFVLSFIFSLTLSFFLPFLPSLVRLLRFLSVVE
jgi:hypothetical protein